MGKLNEKYNGIELNDMDSEIVGILNCFVANNNIKNYVEHYIGFGSIIGNIQCDTKYGISNNKYIVSLMNYLKSGGDIPSDISLGDFEDVKANYLSKSKTYNEWYYGLIGFMVSGLDSCKPFGSRYIVQSELTKCYEKTISSIDNHRTYLDNTDFVFGNIDSIPSDLRDTLIYFKIPKCTKAKFNETLEKLKNLSNNNIVIIKDTQEHEEFELVWKEQGKNEKAVRLYRL